MDFSFVDILERVKLKIQALKVTFLVDTQSRTILDVHSTTIRQHDIQIGPKLTEWNLERSGRWQRIKAMMTARIGADSEPVKTPFDQNREFKP
jgi:hypothetical protein